MGTVPENRQGMGAGCCLEEKGKMNKGVMSLEEKERSCLVWMFKCMESCSDTHLSDQISQNNRKKSFLNVRCVSISQHRMALLIQMPPVVLPGPSEMP